MLLMYGNLILALAEPPVLAPQCTIIACPNHMNTSAAVMCIMLTQPTAAAPSIPGGVSPVLHSTGQTVLQQQDTSPVQFNSLQNNHLVCPHAPVAVDHTRPQRNTAIGEVPPQRLLSFTLATHIATQHQLCMWQSIGMAAEIASHSDISHGVLTPIMPVAGHDGVQHNRV